MRIRGMQRLLNGLTLTEQRHDLGWSVEHTARQAKVTPKAVARAEVGRNVHRRTLLRLCRALKLRFRDGQVRRREDV
jgi:predicted transcriptional regulator